MSECSVGQQRDFASRSRFGCGTLLRPSKKVPFWLDELETRCAVRQFWIQAICAEHGAHVGSFADSEERGDRAAPEITRISGEIAAPPTGENKWSGSPHLHW